MHELYQGKLMSMGSDIQSERASGKKQAIESPPISCVRSTTKGLSHGPGKEGLSGQVYSDWSEGEGGFRPIKDNPGRNKDSILQPNSILLCKLPNFCKAKIAPLTFCQCVLSMSFTYFFPPPLSLSIFFLFKSTLAFHFPRPLLFTCPL